LRHIIVFNSHIMLVNVQSEKSLGQILIEWSMSVNLLTSEL
jgi:hypothetical protein